MVDGFKMFNTFSSLLLSSFLFLVHSLNVSSVSKSYLQVKLQFWFKSNLFHLIACSFYVLFRKSWGKSMLNLASCCKMSQLLVRTMRETIPGYCVVECDFVSVKYLDIMRVLITFACSQT